MKTQHTSRWLWAPLALLGFTSIMCLAVLALSSASAQTTSKGSIEGIAVGPDGAAVPGLTVTVTRQGGGSASGTTNDEGFFRIRNLDPGIYTVTIEAGNGFAKFEQASVPVNLSRTTNLTVQLRPMSASETVTVTESSGAAIDVAPNTPAGAEKAVSTTQFSNFETANVKTNSGLTTATFDTNAGKIQVHLPDDMRAGDTISGTVVTEPKGTTETERNSNLSQFKDLVVQFKAPAELGAPPGTGLTDTIVFVADTSGNRVQRSTDGGRTWQIFAGGSTPPNGSTFSHQLPPVIGDPPNVLEIRLNRVTSDNALPGQTLSTTTIQGSSPNRFPIIGGTEQNPFTIPTLGQQGRALEIFGPFDGNSGNTTFRFGPQGSTLQDFEKNTESVSGGFGLIRPLAESPRKIVFQAPANVTGPIGLNVKDGDAQTIGVCRIVGVNLSAPKTNLLKGEKTILTTQVTGLAGIKEPVPLTLEAKGVITMKGGMFQPLHIQPSQVGAAGTYVTTRTITGIQAGGWSATSTVVTTPFNIVLRDPNPPQTIVFNSFTGDYVFCGGGSKLSGTGKIQMKGCIITLTHDAPDRRVFGRLDACVPVDNGRYFSFYAPVTNTDIVVTVTDTKPSRTRLYFNPLGKPAPPVQDTSAFATCP